ncbi:DUF1302 domain-containing protein [Pseudomonas sp. Gutcm_11s]|uniref:DUF1302 domain-containing protein n=1 Tax=Pseudomonas sp. Gutcm_11s TaxID=3026088 RepID=UPI00235FE3B4|nr:DUF1302 domain-containing protein [Pseudomonas sp. Gutcm_11s]MDD0842633.1 DUF1302 domain-containing protein [Pseudomonas sp. Gutcm_11s]
MVIPLRKSSLCFAPAKAGFALAGLIPLMLAVPAGAVEFSLIDDQVTGSLDTTLSYGQLYRVQGQDKTNDDTNGNDGNRNFDTGLVSEVYKVTSDLEANYQNYGLFVRGTAFYDTQIMDKRNDNDDFRPSQSYPNNDRFTYETRHTAGRSAEILDAYVYGNWDVAEMPLTVKVGRQVFNWGEGIFYRGGINTSNPVDAGKFRLPGAELKEVLVPVEAFNFNVGLTDNLSMEAYYQWNWKETAIDPVGTFFSETDLFADGGSTAYTRYDNPLLPVVMSGYQSAAAAGLVGNGPFGPNAYLDPNYNVFKVANVGKDINAKNDGQYGLAFRYVAEELNLTEFGFYFMNYHAKEPQIAVDLQAYDGVDMTALQAAQGPALAPAVATLDAASNAVARREYVEDIRVYGLSFNTTIGEASVFGELSYRPNLPVGLSSTNDLLGDLLGQGFFNGTNIYDSNVPDAQACADISGKQLCRADIFHNYERVEAYNLSLGTIYNFGPSLSFDSLFGVAELASEHVRASSLSYTAYDGSKRGFSGRANGAYVSGYGSEDQLDPDAYGYTLALSGTWNDVYAGVNLSPFGVFKHDFQGNSHQTGNFIEGRMAYTVGLKASYLNSLEAEVQYTEFYGAGQNNSGRDRDNLGINVKYSF